MSQSLRIEKQGIKLFTPIKARSNEEEVDCPVEAPEEEIKKGEGD